MIKHLFLMTAFVLIISLNINANSIAPIRDPFVPFAHINVHAHNKQIKKRFHSSPLKTSWISLYFAKAHDVANFLSQKNLGILSARGKIHDDKRSNQIWLREDKVHTMKIKAIIQHLDHTGPQFLIKARIVNIDREYQKSLGVLFNTSIQQDSPTTKLSMNLPKSTVNTGQFTFTVAKFAQSRLLNVQISALEQEGHASLISSPTLITLNKHPAVIESGAEVPYQEATSSGATSVDFKKAVLRLKVTPQKMPNHRVLLNIELNQDKVSPLTVNGVPAIQTQRLTTQVLMKNKQTVVLGGIIERSDSIQRAGIPVLNHLPVIGGLFRHHKHLRLKQELLILITPKSLS